MANLSFPTLSFIEREKKPREKGINYVRAPVMVAWWRIELRKGVSHGQFIISNFVFH